MTALCTSLPQYNVVVTTFTSPPPLSRYLHKLFAAQRPVSALPDNVSYLGADYPGHMTFPLQTAAQFSDAHLLLEAYRQRARRLVSMATDTYKAGLSRGLSHSDSWNGSTIDWTVAARVSVYVCVV